MQGFAAISAVVVLAAGAAAPAFAYHDDHVTSLRGSAQYPSARGYSEYDPEGAHRELEVTLRGIRQLAGRSIGVFVGGRRVGTIRVSSRGRAHREWDTEHGQRVPIVRAGTRVRVRTAAGTLIASGVFRREAHD